MSRTAFSEQVLRQDLNDLLGGAAFYGSGGGGPRKVAEQIIDMIVAAGMPPVVAPAQMNDDDWAIIAAGVGSPDASSGFDPKVGADAVRAVEWALGIDITHMLAVEVGAGNTFMPIAAAHYLGCKVLDAATATRAIPEITMSTLGANNVPVGQMALANATASLTMSAQTPADLGPAMHSLLSNPPFQQQAGLAIWPVKGAVVKKYAVAGTLTRARKLGAKIRLADPASRVQAVIDATGGVLLGQGTAQIKTVTEGGFDHSLITVPAVAGGDLHIVAVNENLLAYSSRTGAVAVGPDLISYMAEDGTTISNAELESGQRISVIGAPAGSVMMAPAIVSQFSDALGGMGYYGPVPVLS